MNEPTVDDSSVNYQSGKVSGVFVVGSKIEALQVSYDDETKTFDSMKAGIALAAQGLMNYRSQILDGFKSGKLPIKEAEVAKVHITRCIELVEKLFNDTEAKRLQAIGAAEALRKVVDSAKRVYDDENDKLKRYVDFSQSEKDPKQRPVGYPPAHQKQKGGAKQPKRVT